MACECQVVRLDLIVVSAIVYEVSVHERLFGRKHGVYEVSVAGMEHAVADATQAAAVAVVVVVQPVPHRQAGLSSCINRRRTPCVRRTICKLRV
jgi:hypothetical protein